jgi:hypothetical protein
MTIRLLSGEMLCRFYLPSREWPWRWYALVSAVGIASGAARYLLSKLGLLLLLAGPIFPLMQLYDYATCEPAVANVVAVETVCSVRACRRCENQTVRCDASQRAAGSYAGVERTRHAKIAFKTLEGHPIQSSPTFGKLNLDEARVGETIPIIYRKSYPRYVAPRFAIRDTLLGFGVMALGGLLLALSRQSR